MGLSNSFVSLGRVAGPIVAGIIFDINPNFPYVSGALILFIVFVLSLLWIKDERPLSAELETVKEKP